MSDQKLTVEISLYPLDANYVPCIKAFIQQLNTYDTIFINTSATSTQICGDYDTVMQILHKEMKLTHEQEGKAVFVCKFLNIDITDPERHK